MTQAVRYLGVLSGREIAVEDAAWLKQRWTEEYGKSPQVVVSKLDELALKFKLHLLQENPLALAEDRTTVVKNAYCAAAQTSDPARLRLRGILAFDDLVLAADCALGLVVTRFDVEGLVASHAQIAAAAGLEHDGDREKAEIASAVRNDFAAFALAEKALLANAELRHAVLARYLSWIGGLPERSAVAEGTRSDAAANLRKFARTIENAALSNLAEIDDAALTAEAVGAYIRWLERIVGVRLASQDRAWLGQGIVDDFRGDPRATLREIAGIRSLDKAYQAADTSAAQGQLVGGWARDLFCFLSASSDPDAERLLQVVFRHDPVVEADCGAGWITRKRDAFLVEADGQRLGQRDLDVSLRFAAMLLGRPLHPEEQQVVRDDDVHGFKENPDSWREENAQYRAILEKIDNRGNNAFLKMDERKKLFDSVYCALQESNDAFANDYLAMFRRGGAIVFEDCSREIVTTQEEIDAVISFVNFLTLLNARPPLSQEEVAEIRQSLKFEDLDDAESAMIAVSEWWALLTLEEKAAEIQNVRERGVTPEADSATIQSFVQSAKLQVVTRNAQLNQCKLMAVVAQGNAGILAAKQGRSHLGQDGDLADFPGEDYATLVTSNAMFAELCSQVLGGR